MRCMALPLVPIGVLFDVPAHCRSVFISVALFVSVTVHVAPFMRIEGKVNALRHQLLTLTHIVSSMCVLVSVTTCVCLTVGPFILIESVTVLVCSLSSCARCS